MLYTRKIRLTYTHKRWQPPLLLRIMVVGFCLSFNLTPEALAVIPGDANGDKRIDISDVKMIAQWALRARYLPPERLFRGDCYPPNYNLRPPGDGRLTDKDVHQALRMALGLEKPVELGPIVITVAGSGDFGKHWIGGYRDGPALQAQFSDPWDVTVDDRDNVYITDSFGHRVRVLTPEGFVQTVAGTGTPGYRDGPALQAQFNTPYAITLGPDGSLYIADFMNHCIRRITPDRQWVETVAGTGERGYQDGPAYQAQFAMPTSVEVHPDGSLWVADTGNHRIRRISPEGMVTTIAGSGHRGWKNGPALEAEFWGVTGLWIDRRTREVYIAEIGNNLIRKLTTSGEVVTVSGIGRNGYRDGPAEQAAFSLPFAFDQDLDGGLLIVDWGNGSIRKLKEGIVTTLAGIGLPGYEDGMAQKARFRGLMGIAVDKRGDIYCADTDNQRIRKVLR